MSSVAIVNYLIFNLEDEWIYGFSCFNLRNEIS